jgi:hypothetical protein
LPNSLIDTLYAVQENGWMTQDIFKDYLDRFIKFVTRTRKEGARTLLLVDGHKSRVSLEAIKLAFDNGVDIFLFPPHTTHLLQPLDVAVFQPFKDDYRIQIKAHFDSGKGAIHR